MAAPRTTHILRVRSYELRPEGRVGNISFLNWFQEAAYANSTELGYSPRRYQELGVSWVMRRNDLEIVKRPAFDERVHITTWVADLRRVTSARQYEARREDGSLLARCNTEWAMMDLSTQRPTRIPAQMHDVFEPGLDYVLEEIEWPEVEGEPYHSQRLVSFYEEDELAHVNNAVYLNWIEENARRAAQQATLPAPTFRRHLLTYRLPAVKDNELTLRSIYRPYGNGLAWQHQILRGDDLLVEARSLSV